MALLKCLAMSETLIAHASIIAAAMVAFENAIAADCFGQRAAPQHVPLLTHTAGGFFRTHVLLARRTGHVQDSLGSQDSGSCPVLFDTASAVITATVVAFSTAVAHFHPTALHVWCRTAVLGGREASSVFTRTWPVHSNLHFISSLWVVGEGLGVG